MDLSEFDFELPEDCIALRPAEPRDACRLLHVVGADIADRQFLELADLLRPGDLLIGNDTKVIPALLQAVRPARTDIGQDVDVTINLLERGGDSEWLCLCRPGRRLQPGDLLVFSDVLRAETLSKGEEGRVQLRFNMTGSAFWSEIEAIGNMPIPPYIAKKRKSDSSDHENYQTVFARQAGSVAAPTAGLHFTQGVFESLKTRGVDFQTVTLHVGAGTFAALTEANLKSGQLHSEYYHVPAVTKDALMRAKSEGRRVIAIGTTALRTLESIADRLSEGSELSGSTSIFIRPGYKFRLTNGLITNFHLPQSSLFMLVCALIGTDTMQRAYAHAVQAGYKFYSYGDACLLMPQND